MKPVTVLIAHSAIQPITYEHAHTLRPLLPARPHARGVSMRSSRPAAVHIESVVLSGQIQNGTAAYDSAGGRNARAGRGLDPSVPHLVERCVQDRLEDVIHGQVHPRKALQAVAARLVAELSAEQVGSRHCHRGHTPLQCPSYGAVRSAQPRGGGPGPLAAPRRPFWRERQARLSSRGVGGGRAVVRRGRTPPLPPPPRSAV